MTRDLVNGIGRGIRLARSESRLFVGSPPDGELRLRNQAHPAPIYSILWVSSFPPTSGYLSSNVCIICVAVKEVANVYLLEVAVDC